MARGKAKVSIEEVQSMKTMAQWREEDELQAELKKKALEKNESQISEALELAAPSETDSNKSRKCFASTPQKIAMQRQKEAFLGYIAKGLSQTDAAKITHISYDRVQHWKKTDEQFFKDFLEALTVFKLSHIENIAMHSQAHWQASKFLLERKFPEEFGEKTFSKVETTIGQKEDSLVAKLLEQLLPKKQEQVQVQVSTEETSMRAPTPIIPISSPFAWQHGSEDPEDEFLEAEDPEAFENDLYPEDDDEEQDD